MFDANNAHNAFQHGNNVQTEHWKNLDYSQDVAKFTPAGLQECVNSVSNDILYSFDDEVTLKDEMEALDDPTILKELYPGEVWQSIEPDCVAIGAMKGGEVDNDDFDMVMSSPIQEAAKSPSYRPMSPGDFTQVRRSPSFCPSSPSDRQHEKKSPSFCPESPTFLPVSATYKSDDWNRENASASHLVRQPPVPLQLSLPPLRSVLGDFLISDRLPSIEVMYARTIWEQNMRQQEQANAYLRPSHLTL